MILFKILKLQEFWFEIQCVVLWNKSYSFLWINSLPCPWTSKILHFNCIIHLSQCFGAFFGCRFSVKSALLDLMRQIAVAKEDAWPKSCIDAKVLCLLHRKVIKLPFFNSYKQALQFWLEEKSKSVWKPHHHTKSLYFDI